MADQNTSQTGRGQGGPGSSEKAFIYSVNADSHDEIEIDLGELFGVVLHWLWLIIVVALACGIAGYCVSRFLIAETFESTTKIYVLDKSDTSTQSTYTELQTGSQLTNDYAEIITSRAVLEEVMSDNNLLDVYTYDEFLEKVEVDVPDSTRIVSITVTDTDPAMAQELANDIRIAASELILETMEIDAVNTFEEANYPTEKAAPSNSRNAIIAAILGALLVIVVVVVRYLLDDTVKTSEDVERYLNLSTLALIPLDENLNGVSEKKEKSHRKAKKAKKGKAEREERESAPAARESAPPEEAREDYEDPAQPRRGEDVHRDRGGPAPASSDAQSRYRAYASGMEQRGQKAAHGRSAARRSESVGEDDSEPDGIRSGRGASPVADESGNAAAASSSAHDDVASKRSRTGPLRSLPSDEDYASLDDILKDVDDGDEFSE